MTATIARPLLNEEIDHVTRQVIRRDYGGAHAKIDNETGDFLLPHPLRSIRIGGYTFVPLEAAHLKDQAAIENEWRMLIEQNPELGNKGFTLA